MNDLDLLRRLGTDTAPPSTEHMTRLRHRIMTSLPAETGTGAGHERLRRPSRRPAVVVAAIAATAVVVTAGGLGLTHPAPANAASVLNGAATATAHATPVTAGPGSYLEVTTQEVGMGYVQSAQNQISGGYLIPTRQTTWVPQRRTAQWVQKTVTLPVSKIYGGADAQAAAERDYQQDQGSDAVNRANSGHFVRELGGGWSDTTTDFATLPRDPAALLDALETSREEASPNGPAKAMSLVTSKLRTGLVPADLQAAMYRAVALIPGIRITHAQATLDGRSGTALGFVVSSSETDEIIVDPGTGAYIGSRQLQTTRLGAVPAGTVVDSTSMTTRVVSSAP